jgi:peptide/nickel transport system ATP-binding protein/oligopeptide transport system ATP-binding protein
MQERLVAIEGQVPNPHHPVRGCAFHPRCPFAGDECRRAPPPLADVVEGHRVACFKAPLEVTVLPT